MLSKDLSLKIAALIVALLLWAGINVFGMQTITVDGITPDVVNMPSNLGIGQDLPKITVKLKVSKAYSVPLDGKMARALIDLEGSGLGERDVPVSVNSQIPNSEIVSISPSTVKVILDPIVERQVPVRVVPDGSPADGYRIAEVKAIPDKVMLRGALSIFQKYSSGVDAKINVNGAKSSFEGDATIDLSSIAAETTPASVKVNVTIEQSEDMKNVGIHVVTKGAPDAGYFVKTINTEPTTVMIKGVREIIDKLTVVDTASLEIKGSKSYEQLVKLSLPTGVEIVSGDDSVKAKIDIGVLEQTKEINAGISVTDVPEGQRVSNISPGTVRVTVRGQGADKLKEDDVRVVISASGREGSFTTKASVDDVRTSGQVRAVSVDSRDIIVSLESQ